MQLGRRSQVEPSENKKGTKYCLTFVWVSVISAIRLLLLFAWPTALPFRPGHPLRAISILHCELPKFHNSDFSLSWPSDFPLFLRQFWFVGIKSRYEWLGSGLMAQRSWPKVLLGLNANVLKLFELHFNPRFL